ncbi:MAG: hypothetical protein JOZ69_12425 [Myxococcales bacterium]|nr:hypothetical protein [Myxococcales bacterium]
MLGQFAASTGCHPVDVFRDPDFVRFMLELDPVLLSDGHEHRGLYRRAMKGLLPEALRTRRDKAFFEPAIAAAGVAAGALDALRDLSSLEDLATRGLADPAAFRPTGDDALAILGRGARAEAGPGDDRVQELWQLLSAEAFLRQHGKGRALA